MGGPATQHLFPGQLGCGPPLLVIGFVVGRSGRRSGRSLLPCSSCLSIVFHTAQQTYVHHSITAQGDPSSQSPSAADLSCGVGEVC